MKTLRQVQQELGAGQFDFSRHAFRRAVERNISEQEIRDAGANAEVIENYPQDKYSPSGLLLGITRAGRALHFQVSFTESETTRIITIYEPDPNEWIEKPKAEVAMFDCHVCGHNAAKPELVSEVFNLEGRRVLVENIPALVCERCGEVAFSRETTEQVRQLVHGTARPVKTVPMDVFAMA